MKELLDKISSYNLFNYLLPGIIFAVVASRISRYSLVQEDLLLALFLYYFIGLVISRFGSLVVEPFLRRTGFVKFADYGDFVSACRKDEKIELLSEVNNSYRTLCSLFVLLGVLKLWELLAIKYPALQDLSMVVLAVLLFAMFLFSYRKQVKYIRKRVEIAND